MSARALEAGEAARSLFALPTLDVAERILGWRLVREAGSDRDDSERREGRIVEVEAYIGEEDLASHARFGQTERNRVMYGPPGRAYVYLVYGMHDCLNLVTEPPGTPAALLIRAVEPIAGIDTMRAARQRRMRTRTKNRHTSVAPRPSPVPAHRLAAGPGLVCAAFDLDRTLTWADLLDPEAVVRVEPAPADEAAPTVVRGPRIGVAYAGDRWATVPWRFAIAANPAVSRPAITR